MYDSKLSIKCTCGLEMAYYLAYLTKGGSLKGVWSVAIPYSLIPGDLDRLAEENLAECFSMPDLCAAIMMSSHQIK